MGHYSQLHTVVGHCSTAILEFATAHILYIMWVVWIDLLDFISYLQQQQLNHTEDESFGESEQKKSSIICYLLKSQKNPLNYGVFNAYRIFPFPKT